MADRGKPRSGLTLTIPTPILLFVGYECLPDLRRVFLPLHKLDYDPFRSSDEGEP